MSEKTYTKAEVFGALSATVRLTVPETVVCLHDRAMLEIDPEYREWLAGYAAEQGTLLASILGIDVAIEFSRAGVESITDTIKAAVGSYEHCHTVKEEQGKEYSK